MNCHTMFIVPTRTQVSAAGFLCKSRIFRSWRTEVSARFQREKRVNVEGVQFFGTRSGSKISGRERALATDWALLLPTAAGSLALVVLLFRSRDRLLVKVVRFCGHEKIVAV